MRKVFRLCFMMLFLLLCGAILTFSASANPDGPPIITPIQYDEIPCNMSPSITWNAPASGSVSKYVINIRELKIKDEVTNVLVVSGVERTSSQRSYVIPAGTLNRFGTYRLSVCAVMTDGSKKWSDERYFFVSISRGIDLNNTISFRIWNGFEYETKEAIYYCARRWSDALGVEVVNTYPYDQGTTLTVVNNEDNISTVTPYNDPESRYLMVAHSRWDNNNKTVEVDIAINHGHPWSNEVHPSKYHVQNVMNHEMGHAVGLSDKYETFCSEWTMFGSMELGETKKVSISDADIISLYRLYAYI